MNRSFEVAPRRVALLAVLAVSLAACKGDPGEAGPVGPAGPAGVAGTAGATGPQGAAGPGGKSSLTASTPEPAGANCATGGVKVDFGLDQDGNGVLDPSEVDLLRTQYLCAGPVGPQGAQGMTGAAGANGANGKNSLALSAPEAPGVHCATGGVKVDFGLDADGSGVLEPGEVDPLLTQYVCAGVQGVQGPPGPTGASGANGTNGTDGRNSLTATAAEAAGANCATGGVKVDYGLDANGNGVLDGVEVNASLRRFVCNGAQGPQGIQGAQGAAGTLGAYGDGSAGVLNIGGPVDWSTSFPGGSLQYTDINVQAGATWTVPSGTILRATGNVTIAGTINVLPGSADNGQLRPSGGVSINPAAGPGQGLGITRMAATNLIRIPVFAGGAGARNTSCSGGEGGGSFAIYARGTVNVGAAGSINANGANSANLGTNNIGCGGGGGGLIVLIGRSSLLMSGALRANGGNGSAGLWGSMAGNSQGGGGGGGGGIIHLLSSVAPSITGTTPTAAGAAGANGGPGPNFASGGGGGACAGNGGVGATTASPTPTAGTAGYLIITTLATPEALLL